MLRQLNHRNEFPSLFQDMGYKVGIEIGTLEGDFAETIAKTWKGKLSCVDAWRHQEGYLDGSNYDDVYFEAMYLRVLKRLEPLGVTLIRNYSVEAASGFEDGSLDWVYIDANHSREAVEADLNAWWPKVRSGGIVSGHDYIDTVCVFGVFGVKSAVDGFLVQRGLVPMVTDKDGSFSWYVLKP